MSPNEQKNFITSLTDAIVIEIFGKINEGKIPEEWNGFELRELLADKFDNERANMTRTHHREYKNTVLVNNI